MDRPELTIEIEVTSQMIEAGARLFSGKYAETEVRLFDLEELVADLYRVMVAARTLGPEDVDALLDSLARLEYSPFEGYLPL
tara:strand:- start:10982 stop:11227 length:246 start_codon:yes stop_codon:yes gene_type:complete